MQSASLEQISKTDYGAAALIFLVALLAFWFSPVHQLTDSNYSMLLSESLLKHRSFALDSYQIPRREPRYHDNTYKNGEMYQLELVGPHLYYYLPPGTSVLSLPYVALMNAMGISAANPDGTYNPDGEETIETGLAAILMAGLSCILFFTSRLVLPLGWSAAVALTAAFATQLWSTASRALWSDTWGVFLLGIVVWMLLANEVNRRKLNPIALATLLAWSYFVRPTNVVSIVAVTIYVALFYRRRFFTYAATGGVWLILFVVYSWHNFHQLLPNYFLANRLSFSAFWTAFAGNLISPSRGLLVFVPVLVFVAYLLVRYREHLPFQRMVLLALLVIAVHLVIVAGFTPWNGGFCYGPRYTTGVVPWLVLLAIAGLRAMIGKNPDRRSFSRVSELSLGALLVIVSVLVNGRGAVARETWEWNKTPTNVDEVAGKIWDWRQPQFLAGLVHPTLPRDFPALAGRIDFNAPVSNRFLWYGWSQAEPESRWSDGNEAAVIFALKEFTDSVLQIRMAPFLAPSISEQRVKLVLNGQDLQTFVVKNEALQIYEARVPKELLGPNNIMTFKLPDAASPKTLNVSSDQRKLGIRVQWLSLQKVPVSP
jgi:hypothetical protein